MTRKPAKSKKPAKLTRKRDSRGRFLPAPKAPVQAALRLRDKFGRFVKAKKPGKRKPSKPVRTRIIKQGKDGRFRDENGRFVHVEMSEVTEHGHHDGRKNDPIRFRDRLTFQEMVNLYGFDDYAELPEWLQYLDGAP